MNKRVIKIIGTIVLLVIFVGISFMLHLLGKINFGSIDDTAIRITVMYIIPTVFLIGGVSFPLVVIWTKKEKNEI